jgi:hypothetical protein
LNNTKYDISSIQDQEFVNQNVLINLIILARELYLLDGSTNRFGNVSSEFDNDSFVLIGEGYKFAGIKPR